MRNLILLLAMSAALVGCKTGYVWTSPVPEAMRTVSVPTFVNGSDTTEAGAVASRAVLREIQREGTFKIASHDDAALEVQGEIVSYSSVGVAGSRRTEYRLRAYEITMTAKVSVVDRRNGRVLVSGRVYTAKTTAAGGGDVMTVGRDAAGRVADELARQIVDDLTGFRY